eukprot:XP_023156760.1 uncharacterized protein LOC100500949 isoform X2 [Zea mays]
MLRDCSYVLLVLFRLYGQRNRSYYTREIEDTILLALQKPEVYDDIARATCCKFGIDRPQVVPVQGLPQVKGWENVECFFRYYFLVCQICLTQMQVCSNVAKNNCLTNCQHVCFQQSCPEKKR